jgi:hypothetical protein
VRQPGLVHDGVLYRSLEALYEWISETATQNRLEGRYRGFRICGCGIFSGVAHHHFAYGVPADVGGGAHIAVLVRYDLRFPFPQHSDAAVRCTCGYVDQDYVWLAALLHVVTEVNPNSGHLDAKTEVKQV